MWRKLCRKHSIILKRMMYGTLIGRPWSWEPHTRFGLVPTFGLDQCSEFCTCGTALVRDAAQSPKCLLINDCWLLHAEVKHLFSARAEVNDTWSFFMPYTKSWAHKLNFPEDYSLMQNDTVTQIRQNYNSVWYNEDPDKGFHISWGFG